MSTSDPTSAKPLVVLLVEEELVLRFFMAELLTEAGFTVIEACTADEACLALATHLEINAAIVELTCTGTAADVILAEVIALQFPRIALFLTAGSPVPAGMALPLRATVLSKPYDPTRIRALIEQAVEKASVNTEPFIPPSVEASVTALEKPQSQQKSSRAKIRKAKVDDPDRGCLG